MVLVAIGSNLSDSEKRAPIDLCRWAVRQLAALPRLSLQAMSFWYRTAPIPASDQPDYINGVAALMGDAAPEAILEELHLIEERAGRCRDLVNGARTLDLDLLAVGAQVRSGPGLILPHPRLQDRSFVLEPLADVAPDWRHPVLGQTVMEIRRRLASLAETQRADRIEPEPQDLLLHARGLT